LSLHKRCPTSSNLEKPENLEIPNFHRFDGRGFSSHLGERETEIWNPVPLKKRAGQNMIPSLTRFLSDKKIRKGSPMELKPSRQKQAM